MAWNREISALILYSNMFTSSYAMSVGIWNYYGTKFSVFMFALTFTGFLAS